MTGSYDGSDNASATLVSQLFFDDTMVDALFTDVALYAPFGIPDTHLDDDNVVGGETDPSPYVLDVERMSDGAMLASKTLVIRSSSASQCTIASAR